MDKLAQENHSNCTSSEEFERYQKNWYITLNKSGRNAPMKLRSDFREALTNMRRLHRESGEERPKPIPLYQYQRWRSSSSSSSTSWWQWNEHWWSSYIKECQLPLSSWNEQHQRTGRPVFDDNSSSYSVWNADKNWSSQEWISDELMEVRTGRPVYEQPPVTMIWTLTPSQNQTCR